MQLSKHRVLIEQEKPKEKTDSGIYLPQQSVKKRNSGKVILTGEGVDKKLKGKNVLFTLAAGSPFEYENKECTLLYEFDIIAII